MVHAGRHWGCYAAVIAYWRHVAQEKADRLKRLRDDFKTSVDQLGSDQIEARIAGIHALRRLAEERSRSLEPTFVEKASYDARGLEQIKARNRSENNIPIYSTLCAFVRRQRPWLEGASAPPLPISDDVIAALELIFPSKYRANKLVIEAVETWSENIDLHSTDLRGLELTNRYMENANLAGAHFEGAQLGLARLNNANLTNAHFEGAEVQFAKFDNAKLRNAHFNDAKVTEARFDNTDLIYAHFERVKFSPSSFKDARLFETHFEGADLSSAVGLSEEILAGVWGDSATRLPWGMTAPKHWFVSPRPATIEEAQEAAGPK